MDAMHSPASESLRGKRYIAYARCATMEDSATRLEQQIRRIREFADNHGMQCVDEVRLAGVGGIAPSLRPELRALLARKLEVGDFEVLIVEDVARLTRAGLDGGSEIEAEFRSHGVQIVYVTHALGLPAAASRVTNPEAAQR